ncbi:MAG: adenylate/guanylate cyclase domain-containing protein [Pseudanabaenaceae cyanobacterium bins.39]|nr:adenylate/guanylate cyclase domain-containing protein [Pseudanabaenaceae cyanobacterium bins.39]
MSHRLSAIKTIQHLLWKWRGIAIAVPTISLLVIGLRSLGALESWELAMLDQFLRWRSPEPADNRIVLIGIDEQDIRKYKWPLSDALLAKLLQQVNQQKPRAIGLDLARDIPIGQGYDQLQTIFKNTPNLIGATKKADQVDSNFAISSSNIEPPPTLAALGQIGAINLPVDADGRIRRGLLSLRLPDGETTLSFGLQLALLYINSSDAKILSEAALSPPRLQPNDGGYSHIDVGGDQFIINYRRSLQGFEQVSMRDVLQGKVPPDLFRDRVVMIGSTAVSLRDWFFTPLDSGIGSTRILTSGIEVHAQIVSHILSNTLDNRATIKTWQESWEYLWIVLWAGVGATLIWQWRNLSPKDEHKLWVLGWRALSIWGFASILFATCFIALHYGWWLPFVPAAIAFGGSSIVVTSYLAITAAQIRTYFSRYLTDAVVKSILETPEGLRLGGDRRKVTILMCDLRGFSTISERMPPEKVVEILNVFLGKMTEAIALYEGTIDEFIGDAILVLFGAPIYREDDAARAIASAIAMQLAMQSVNEELAQMGLPEIAMGIGINTGEVVAGNIGSQSRAKYAVVGNHVNLTARIESYTVGGQILISENTYGEVADILKTNGSMEVEPKGVSHPINIYDVYGIGGKYNLELPAIGNDLQILEQPIPITYRVLEEKHLGTEIYDGQIQHLSQQGAIILTTEAVPILTNLKIHVQIPQDLLQDLLINQDAGEHGFQIEGEIYGKVLKNNFHLLNTADTASASPQMYIHFTTVPAHLKHWLGDYVASLDQFKNQTQ